MSLHRLVSLETTDGASSLLMGKLQAFERSLKSDMISPDSLFANQPLHYVLKRRAVALAALLQNLVVFYG
jgi:hypothetical protein